MSNKKSELTAVLATCRGTFLMAALFSSVINLLMVVPSLYMMQVMTGCFTVTAWRPW